MIQLRQFRSKPNLDKGVQIYELCGLSGWARDGTIPIVDYCLIRSRIRRHRAPMKHEIRIAVCKRCAVIRPVPDTPSDNHPGLRTHSDG